MTAEAPFARKELPLDRRIGAFKNAKDSVFLFENALDGRRGEDKEGLELSEMKKPHDGVDVRGRQKHTGDRGMSWSGITRTQFRCGENLSSQIRAGGYQEPNLRIGVGRKSDLSLRARTAFESTCPQAATVGTNADPFGKSTPGCLHDHLNAHLSSKCTS